MECIAEGYGVKLIIFLQGDVIDSTISSFTDKKLVVAIEGNVEEAKALCKPPEDSQGKQGP